MKALRSGRPLPSDSQLKSLDPEYDEGSGLVRVGGRLRRAETLEQDMIHPVILDPSHHVTKLLIHFRVFSDKFNMIGLMSVMLLPSAKHRGT